MNILLEQHNLLEKHNINLQNSDARKIHLAIEINFISSKDTEEQCIICSNSDNIKITSYNDANEVVNKLFKSLRSKCQENLKLSMKGSDLNCDSVRLLY